MSGSRISRQRGFALAAFLAVATTLLALAAAAASPAGAATSGGGYVVDPTEFPQNFEKEVNRDVPNSQSAAHVPSSHVPRPQGSAVAGAGAATGFSGLTLKDQRLADGGNQFTLEPPDQGLCVGGGEVVEAVNDVFSTYTDGTSTSGPTSLTEFYTQQPQIVRTPRAYGPFLSDPKCYFDPSLNRFFMTVLRIDTNPNGSFGNHSAELIAVSKTSTPSTDRSGWYFYSIDTTDDGTNGTPSHPGCPCFGDQPLIGADADGFYITSNEFSINGPDFNGAQFYAIDKAGLANGTLRYQAIQGEPIPLAEGPAYSVQPATSPSAADWQTANNGTEYLLSALDFNATLDNRIAVWSLTNTQSLTTATPDVHLSSAVLSSEVYGQPPDAAQKDGPTPLADAVKAHEELLAGNDDRMNQVVYAAGNLFSGLNTVVKTDNGPTHVGIAYFVVSPSGTATQVAGTIANQGYVAVNQQNVMYPSIGVNSLGQGVMTFSLAGPDYYPSAAYTGITAAGNEGVVHVIGAGTRPDDGFTGYAAFGGGGTGRWGDYSAAVAAADGTVWTASEYIPGTFGYPPYLANWGTFVGHVTPTP